MEIDVAIALNRSATAIFVGSETNLKTSVRGRWPRLHCANSTVFVSV
mgnify:CR=1 FL=1